MSNKSMNASPISAVRRNLNVENATNDLDDAVAGLREAVEALENHLAPLLSPEHPRGPCWDRAQGESDLAERILAQADRTRQSSDRIRELIDRL
jgi:hypothetical protein